MGLWLENRKLRERSPSTRACNWLKSKGAATGGVRMSGACVQHRHVRRAQCRRVGAGVHSGASLGSRNVVVMARSCATKMGLSRTAARCNTQRVAVDRRY